MIPPSPGKDDEWFWAGVDQGKLLIQRCESCGTLHHPPVPMCPECGSEEWAPHEASGLGSVHTWILSRHPSRRAETDSASPGAGASRGGDGGSGDRRSGYGGSGDKGGGDGVRIVVLVELEEGPRIVSNLLGVQPEDVRNDMAVAVCFERFDGGVTLPQFRPVDPLPEPGAG